MAQGVASSAKARSNSVIGKKRKKPCADNVEQAQLVPVQPVKLLFENCSHMSVQAIKEALEQGADPNGYTGNKSLGSYKARGSSNEWTPLHYVAMNAHTWSVEELAQCAQLLMQAGALLSLRQRVVFASEEQSIKRMDTVPHIIRREKSSIQKAAYVDAERVAKYDALRNALIQADQASNHALDAVPGVLRDFLLPELCAIVVGYCREKTYQELEDEPYQVYSLVQSQEQN